MNIDKVIAGQKELGFIKIEGTDVELPITVVVGHEEGKTLLITGGVHSAEYVGIQAAIELAQEIRPEQIKGRVIIAPLLNVTGFAHRTMSLVYEDQKNLNREFPGNMEGTLTDKIAATVVKELHNRADYYIDLHCGDGYETLTPYVYYPGMAADEVVEKSLEMAKCVNAPYRVKSGVASGGSYNYAGSCGIPSILLERGQYGIWEEQEVVEDKEDVYRIMNMLGISNLDTAEYSAEQREVVDVRYPQVPISGCWYPIYIVGDTFKDGDLLGTIKDYFGKTLYEFYADMDGVLLYQVASLTVIKGGSLVAYGRVEKERDR
ncbi:succinylglutamate desuccinylase [Alkalibaculum sp. M08DMB]|uniref:Succinylglutamate desuccinylase n=1 Tax=Alkalibaculum sporogenes TaxID=2655001 RepID=A0A6A7K9K8_9FIRM|nr:M14 family metallopeptidase [Alkalibaculum sporogenes]MPW26168.1 succinylglutamate desuccinylase [Alkalibaculum sporogenes]